MATVSTTWVSPVSATLDKATGAIIDEPMTDAWSSDLYHLGGTAGYIGCRASTSAVQSVASGAGLVAIALSAESFDSDPNGAMHDNVTNNTRITIRTAGVYHVAAFSQATANATGMRQVGIRVNGGSYIVLDTRQAPTTGGAGNDVSLYCAYAFNASDYVELLVQHSAGIALDFNGVLTAVKA